MAGEARGLKLKIDNVRKVFSTRNGEMVALNGVNLDIYENEFICVVGPSGCGKSTLLNIIAGLTDATSGTVYCNGKAVSGTGTDRGVVFQQYALFPWLTVKKNVMFALEMKGVKGKQAQDLAMQYLAKVDLEKFADHYPKELSGGMKQRVAIAGVLAMRPRCVVLDEPTAMLDPIGRAEVMKTIRGLNRSSGVTVVLITHHMDEAAQADRVLVMSEGHVVMEGTPKEVFSQTEKVRALRLDVPQAAELRDELVKAGLNLPEGIITEDECAAALYELLK